MYPILTCDPGILPDPGILSPDLLPKSSKNLDTIRFGRERDLKNAKLTQGEQGASEWMQLDGQKRTLCHAKS